VDANGNINTEFAIELLNDATFDIDFRFRLFGETGRFNELMSEAFVDFELLVGNGDATGFLD
jgi:hypothetical protein